MTEAINLVQAGTDKTAAELALKRLSGELQGVDQENLGLDFRRSLQLQTTRKGFTWIWVGGIVLCLIIGGRGGAAGYFSLLLGVFGSVGLVYLWNKRNASILEDFKHEEGELNRRRHTIQMKINHNKSFVD